MSCQKEDTGDRLHLFSESMGGNQKMAVDGISSNWVDGENVRINNQVMTISVENGSATVDNSTLGLTAPYWAVYPGTLNVGTLNSDDSTMTVTLPDSYTYRSDGTHQIIDLPMAAASSGSNLNFKHLTGAIAVRVSNSFGGNMTVEQIEIISDLSQISGPATINFKDIASLSSNDVNVSDAQKRVTMNFGNTAESQLVIADGGSADVMIPVLPVSSDNHFTINIKVKYNGNVYAFSKTQGSGGALARNEMGYAPVDMTYGNENVGHLIQTPSEYNTLVSNINSSATGYTGTIKVTIDGTLDFGGANVNPINLGSNTLIINGINNATIKNLTMNSIYTNYYGLIYAANPSSTLIVNNLTIEDITLPGTNNSNTISYMGAICAYTKGNATINNCTVKNVTLGSSSVANLKPYFGGFIGCVFNNNKTTPCEIAISNCQFYQDIALVNSSTSLTSSEPVIGGILGSIQESSSKIININITGCTASNSSGGDINWNQSFNGGYIGGLIGDCIMSSLSSNNGNLQIKSSTCKINYTFNKSSSTEFNSGGFVGRINSEYFSTSTTYWSNDTVTGSIICNATSSSTASKVNAKKVVGNLDDANNWSGMVDISGMTVNVVTP